MKKPFALFDLEGLSFTVNEKVRVNGNDFRPQKNYTISRVFLREHIASDGLLSLYSFAFKIFRIEIEFSNQKIKFGFNLRAFLNVIPFINCKSESPLVSTISEPKNEQLLLFRS